MGKMIENYSLLNEIGRGSYSTVFKAINVKTKQQVAIKMVRADKFKQYPKLEEGTYNQINILSHLQPSPHIIRYYDMLKTVNNFYFVYQYCNEGTLEKLLKEKGKLTTSQALNFFGQTLDAFRVLNRHNIMHRDLKPQNLLLHNGMIKLADFGFCKPLQNEQEISKTMLGSPIYMAPQVLKGQSYTIKADIWSLGVVLFRMLFGYCPFQSGNIAQLIMLIHKQDLVIPTNVLIPQIVRQLIKKMITKNASQRIQWSQLFTYFVQSGQLKKRQNKLKNSDLGSSASTNNSNLNKSQRTSEVKAPLQIQQESLKFEPNGIRHNLSPTSNILQKKMQQKKQLIIRTHNNILESTQLAISLFNNQRCQAFPLSYIILKDTQVNLNSLLQITKKQTELILSKQFVPIIQSQLSQIKKICSFLQQQVDRVLKIPVDSLQMRKKDFLRVFLQAIMKQSQQGLIEGWRTFEYISQKKIIRKQTLRQMSRQSLYSNLISKLQTLFS